jgi:hypothetical protein
MTDACKYFICIKSSQCSQEERNFQFQLDIQRNKEVLIPLLGLTLDRTCLLEAIELISEDSYTIIKMSCLIAFYDNA